MIEVSKNNMSKHRLVEQVNDKAVELKWRQGPARRHPVKITMTVNATILGQMCAQPDLTGKEMGCRDGKEIVVVVETGKGKIRSK